MCARVCACMCMHVCVFGVCVHGSMGETLDYPVGVTRVVFVVVGERDTLDVAVLNERLCVCVCMCLGVCVCGGEREILASNRT